MADEDLLEEEEESYDEEPEEDGEESVLATQTMEINRLKQRVEILKEVNEKQRIQFKDEMKLLLKPLMQKHKEIQKENIFLKEQIRLFSQVKGYVPKSALPEDSKVVEKLKQELESSQKMIQQLEHDYNNVLHENAVLSQEKENLSQQAGEGFSQADNIISQLEKEKSELIEIINEKDALIEQLATQSSEMSVNLVDFGAPETEESPPVRVDFGLSESEELPPAEVATDDELSKLKDQMTNYEKTFNIIEKEMMNQNSSYDEILASLKESREFLSQYITSP